MEKYLIITNQEIIEALKEALKKTNKNYVTNCSSNLLELYDKLENLDNNNFKVDDFQDIQVFINGVHYWITSEISIHRFNKAGSYELEFTFSIKKNSKQHCELFKVHY